MEVVQLTDGPAAEWYELYKRSVQWVPSPIEHFGGPLVVGPDIAALIQRVDDLEYQLKALSAALPALIKAALIDQKPVEGDVRVAFPTRAQLAGDGSPR